MDCKRGLTAVNVLSVEQAKVHLHVHTLDTEFKHYHMNVVDLLVDEGEVEREQVIIDENESRVAHIFVNLKELSPPVERMIKAESKELDVLQRLLIDVERSM